MTKPMHDYTTLDAHILAAIKANKAGNGRGLPFAYIMRADVRMEAERLAAVPGEQAPPGRIVDRRLQALRKAGKILSTSRGWLPEAAQ